MGDDLEEFREIDEAAKLRADRITTAATGVKRDGDTVWVTMPATDNPELGDYDKLLRDRGLDPDEWTVISVKANEWDAMTSDKKHGDNQIVRMRQWTITLKPAAAKILALPAVHVPTLKRSKVGAAPSQRPDTILIEGDHQVPYHDPDLHEASLRMIRDLARKHRLTEHIFLGDTMDLPTISRYPDHPAAMATVNECIQGGYELLRDKCEAAPNVRRRKLKGNHDWRLESELLVRAERMYGIRPASVTGEAELPSLSLRRLLHLDELGIELVEDSRGWEHAEVEVVPGPLGLVVRHGWLVGAKTAENTVRKRGRSIIVGHVHRREHVFVWDPSMGCERVGVVAGTMSRSRDAQFPHFAIEDNWLQGCVIVTRWPDDSFEVEHARWRGDALRWRSESWSVPAMVAA